MLQKQSVIRLSVENETKVATTANQNKKYLRSQLESKVKITKLPEARENASDQVALSTRLVLVLNLIG